MYWSNEGSEEIKNKYMVLCMVDFSEGKEGHPKITKDHFIGSASLKHGFSTLNLNPQLQAAAA